MLLNSTIFETVNVDSYNRVYDYEIPIVDNAKLLLESNRFKELHDEYMNLHYEQLSTLYDEWCKGIIEEDEYDEEVEIISMEADNYAAESMGIDITKCHTYIA